MSIILYEKPFLPRKNQHHLKTYYTQITSGRTKANADIAALRITENSKIKSLPFPISLSIRISPTGTSINDLAIANPRPRPGSSAVFSPH
jgi:hypothetical protein